MIERLTRARRRPLFLFLHTYAAHNYGAASSDLTSLGASPEEIRRLLDRLSSTSTLERLEAIQSFGENEESRADLLKIYDATVRAADRLVGEVVDALRSSGRLDRTIVIITSDHGEELFEHGRFGHGGALVDEVLHVPLIIRGPGIGARRVGQTVSLIDVAPTLRELCGFEQPIVDGRSLVPFLEGREMPDVPAIAQVKSIHGELRTMRGSRNMLSERGDDVSATQIVPIRNGRAAPGSHPADPSIREKMSRALKARLEKSRLIGASAATVRPDAALMEELRELGYLGDS